MASDLPDTGHASSEAMARTLVQYMACPEQVRAAIRLEFDRPPAIRTIERFRAEYLASLNKPPEAPWKAHEGHRPAEASDKASEATWRFLEALRRERERSFRRAANERVIHATHSEAAIPPGKLTVGLSDTESLAA
jgi:hypothetical protein